MTSRATEEMIRLILLSASAGMETLRQHLHRGAGSALPGGNPLPEKDRG